MKLSTITISQAIMMLVLGMMGLIASHAQAQAVNRAPRIGYVYPAGGQQGTTFQVLVGGQFLHGCSQTHFTAPGVTAKIIDKYRPLRLFALEKEQRDELQRRLITQVQLRWSDLQKQGLVEGRIPWSWALRTPVPVADTDKPIEIPKHPLLSDWERKPLRELVYIRETLMTYQRRQPTQQLDESVRLEVTIDRDAKPGMYELRLSGSGGLTNPLYFMVGTLPEASEVEGNDPFEELPIPADPPITLPMTINGQIMPGDVDRFRFQAAAGQNIVVQVQARLLIPFLADAVPGWVQPVVAIYDSQGRELNFADDHQYHPDPMMLFKVPSTGIYELEIRDALHRGREDFIYRINIGELPSITGIHPLGGQTNTAQTVTLEGWNLGNKSLRLTDVKAGIQPLVQDQFTLINHQLMFQGDDIPSIAEREFNNTTQQANSLKLPVTVDGRIDKPGDVDIYQFQVAAGQTIHASVVARRLGSPMDSLLRLMDAQGNVLAVNDDAMAKSGHMHPDMGEHTHHADSIIRHQVKEAGTYYLMVSDTSGAGGTTCSYRLKVGLPEPDYELRISPSSINLVAGQSTPVDVYVLRRDGYDGPIDLHWDNAPKGYELDGGYIPTGCDHIRVTLTAPPQRQTQLLQPLFTGLAHIDGVLRNRIAMPADDVMQAFLWRHLQPAQTMLIHVKGAGRSQPLPKRVDSGIIELTPGQTTTVRYQHQPLPSDRELRLTAEHLPEGITLSPIYTDAKDVCYDILVKDTIKPGLQGNLILQLSAVSNNKGSDGKQKSRVDHLGYLRAVAYRIVEKQP